MSPTVVLYCFIIILIWNWHNIPNLDIMVKSNPHCRPQYTSAYHILLVPLSVYTGFPWPQRYLCAPHRLSSVWGFPRRRCRLVGLWAQQRHSPLSDKADYTQFIDVQYLTLWLPYNKHHLSSFQAITQFRQGYFILRFHGTYPHIQWSYIIHVSTRTIH